MNNLDKLKKEFEDMEVPKELDQMINKTIEANMNSRKKKKFKTIVSSAAAISLLVLPLNLFPSYADSLSDIPFIGSIARVLTLKNYTKKTDNINLDVNLPGLSNLSDADYEDKINRIIDERVDNVLEDAKLRAREYKDAFIATGGSEEDFAKKNLQVGADYKIYSASDDIISFLVYTNESLAAVYASYDYYNIDIKNNSDLSLEKLLGNNYQNIITHSVLRDIEEQKKSEDMVFFDDVNSDDFLVRDDIDFYINKENNIVVVFEKYEIAAGYLGRLEYTIKK